MPMRNCPHCGNGVQDTATICPHCGKTIAFVEKYIHKNQEDIDSKLEKKNYKPWITCGIIFLLPILIGAFNINQYINKCTTYSRGMKIPGGECIQQFDEITEKYPDLKKCEYSPEMASKLINSAKFRRVLQANKKFVKMRIPNAAKCRYLDAFVKDYQKVSSSSDARQYYTFETEILYRLKKTQKHYDPEKESRTPDESWDYHLEISRYENKFNNDFCRGFCVLIPSENVVYSYSGLGPDNGATLSELLYDLKDR